MNKRLEDLNNLVLQLQEERDGERELMHQVLRGNVGSPSRTGCTGGTFTATNELCVAEGSEERHEADVAAMKRSIQQRLHAPSIETRSTLLEPSDGARLSMRTPHFADATPPGSEPGSRSPRCIRPDEDSSASPRFLSGQPTERDASPGDRHGRSRFETFGADSPTRPSERSAPVKPKGKPRGLEDLYADLGRQSRARNTNRSEYWCTDEGYQTPCSSRTLSMRMRDSVAEDVETKSLETAKFGRVSSTTG